MGSRKFKGKKIGKGVAIAAGAAIIIGIGTLSVGQVVRRDSVPSFEKVIEEMRVRSICNKLIQGDVTPLVAHMQKSDEMKNTYYTDDYLGDKYLTVDWDQELQEAYDSCLKGHNMKLNKIDSNYSAITVDGEKVYGDLNIYADLKVDDEMMTLEFKHEGGGIYRICDDTRENEKSGAYEAFSGLLNFTFSEADASFIETLCERTINRDYYRLKNEDASQESVEKAATQLRAYFSVDTTGQTDTEAVAEYKKALEERTLDLYNNGGYIKDLTMSFVSYDKAARKFMRTITVIIEDQNNGKYINLTKDFYYGWGYESVDKESLIFDNGVTAEVRSCVENLF